MVPAFYFRAPRPIAVHCYTLVESSNESFISMTTAFTHLFRKCMLNSNYPMGSGYQVKFNSCSLGAKNLLDERGVYA